MKLIYDVNIMENKKLVIGLNLLAVAMLFPFFYIFVAIAQFFPVGISQSFEADFWMVWLLFLAYLILLSIHELIHGLFFKIYKPDAPLKFGFKWKSLMAYATSPGSRYKRLQMLAIGLAPFVLITLSLTVLAFLGFISTAIYVLLATGHAAGCVGDFYYIYLLFWKFRKEDILIEDTETGLYIYRV